MDLSSLMNRGPIPLPRHALRVATDIPINREISRSVNSFPTSESICIDQGILRSRLMHKRDIAGTSKKVTSTGWVVFDQYVIRGGWIMPARNAQVRIVDPFTDHQLRRRDRLKTAIDGLLAVGAGGTPRTDAIVAWCNEFGLFGLLHQNCLSLNAPAWPFRNGAETTYIRDEFIVSGSSWRAVTHEDLEEREPYAVTFGNAGGFGGRGEELQSPVRLSWDTLCDTYFPAIPVSERYAARFCWPSLFGITADEVYQAWSQYAEPVGHWVSACEQFTQAMRHDDLDALNHLAGRVSVRAERVSANGSRAKRGISQRLSAPSLLSALGSLATQELAGGVRPMLCQTGGCGKLFLASKYQARYCSEECQWRERKRRQRARPKAP